MPGNWLTLTEVSELLGIHPSTVRNWADQGVLPVHRTQGGHRRFMRAELERIAAVDDLSPDVFEIVSNALKLQAP